MTAAASILVISILFVSHFSRPSKSQNEIAGFIEAFGLSTRKCVGVVGRVSPDKAEVDLRGCYERGRFVELRGKILLTVRTGVKLMPSDEISFISRIKKPRDFKNEGVFSYSRYLASRGISAIAFVGDISKIEVNKVSSEHKLLRLAEMLRLQIASSFASVKEDALYGLSLALTIGDDGHVPEEVDDAFRSSGLAHLLVISGLNVAFVAMAIFFLLWRAAACLPRLAERFDLRRPSAFFTIFIVWLYAFVAGLDVSVVRAAIMASVFLAGIAFGRKPDTVNSLSVAAIIILLREPMAIYDISFQLSFVAVLSMALWYKPLVKFFAIERLHRVLRYFAEASLATLSATMGVTPLILYSFKQASLLGFFANLFAVPYAGAIITPLSLVSLSIGGVAPEALGRLQEFFAWSLLPLLKIAQLFALAEARIDFHFSPTLFSVVSAYVLMAGVLFLGNKKRAFIFGSFIAVAVAVDIFAQHGYFEGRKLKVTFIDVGQGSSTLVETPDGRKILIDGGGVVGSTFDIGKNVIAPFLWRRGIYRLDEVVLTHAHPDHYLGLQSVIEKFAPQRFIWNGIYPAEGEDKVFGEFMSRVESSGAAIQVAEGVGVMPDASDLNEASLVLRFDFGKTGFLATGDIGFAREDFLVRGGHLRRVDLISAPHHGSAKSGGREFLKALSPQFGVVQAGEGNVYGFPKKEALSRLEQAGAKVFRTDIDGAVTFVSDGEKFEVEKFID